MKLLITIQVVMMPIHPGLPRQCQFPQKSLETVTWQDTELINESINNVTVATKMADLNHGDLNHWF